MSSSTPSPSVIFSYQNMERSRYAEELATDLAATFSKRAPAHSHFEIFIREFTRREAKRFAVVVNLILADDKIISSHKPHQNNNPQPLLTTLRKGLFLGFGAIRQQLDKQNRQERRQRYLAMKANSNVQVSRPPAQVY